MIEETVKQLAKEIKISTKKLIQQFFNSGIKKKENDFISPKEKEILLLYLNDKEGKKYEKNKKIIYKRRKKTTLNILNSNGKNKLVNVEIRKKYFYIKEIKSDHSKEEKNSIKEIKSDHSKEEKNSIKEIKSDHSKEEKNSIKEIKIKNKEKTNKKNKKNFKKKMKENIYFLNKKNKNWKKNYKTNYNEDYFKQISNFKNNKKDYTTKKDSDHFKANKKNKKNLKNEKNNIEGKKKTFKYKKNISKQKKTNPLQQNFIKPTKKINRKIIIGETISISELANQMALKSSQIIKTMMNMGVMATINQVLDQETAQIIAEEMGHRVILRKENEIEEFLNNRKRQSDFLELRAPIVTIMGHVDHGKTSLLDYIRSTKVTQKESGGITQKIGAYYVKTKNGMITFLDTPGHEAFTKMRSMGTKVTDIVVLVIAADDGVMPQTVEAIKHAQLEKIPIIIAINKIDKQKVDLKKIQNELLKYNIISEDWGGENQFINISVKKGIGINELLDAIFLQSEILELKAIKNCMANGVVIESYLDKGKGPIATILIKEGTLKKGDIILCGLEYGHVRAMRNEFGNNIEFAGPSTPVEIIGLSNVPLVGDKAIVLGSEKKAREIALYRQGKFKEIKLAKKQKKKLENIFDDSKKDNNNKINILLKADTQGRREAIVESLKKLSNDKIKINVVFSGVGSITESDTTLAITSKSIIIGFYVHPNRTAKRIIKNENLDFRFYSIIYNLIDSVKNLINKKFKPKKETRKIGIAEIRNIFKSSKLSIIAGCLVIEGFIKKNCPIKIFRNNIMIYEGFSESIRRFKEDVEEVKTGIECGVTIKNFNKINIGDIVKFFEIYEK